MNIPEKKLNKVEELVQTYLPYFEDLEIDQVCKWIDQPVRNEKGETDTMKVAIYANEIIEFANFLYTNDLLDNNYMDTMSIYAADQKELEELVYNIDSANYALTMAILTCIIRQEQYFSGLWAMAITGRWFVYILHRLSAMVMTDKY